LILQLQKHRSIQIGLVASWVVFLLANGVPAQAMHEVYSCAAQAGAHSHPVKSKSCCCDTSAKSCDCDFEQSGPAEKAEALPVTSSTLQRPVDGYGVLLHSVVHPALPSYDPTSVSDNGVSPPGPTVKLYLQTHSLLI
jgi:hypothetical protein